MKHLKSYNESINIFRNLKIKYICNKYGITNYTINDDGSIDVNGGVSLEIRDLTEIPLKFGKVSGHFNCGRNNLTSLEGCPKSVGGVFDCHDNDLTTLKGCPKLVDGFTCTDNILTSLEGCPESVGGGFTCRYNRIVTFEHLPLSIGGEFRCNSNPIFEIWKLFEDYDKIEFLNDCDPIREPDANSKEPIVILDRLNFFLEEIGKSPVEEVRRYKCI